MEQKNLISLTMFDLLKGTLMLVVVLRHSIIWDVNGQLVWRILYSVMMPVCFVTSGYWLKKRKCKAGLESSVKFLLKPFLIVMLIINGVGAVHRLLLHNIHEWLEVFLIPTLCVKSGEQTRIGAMWFVFALFLSWCLFYIVINRWERKLQMAAVLLCGGVCGVTMPWQLPFQISQGLGGFFLVYGGYTIKKEKLLEKKLPFWCYLAMVLLWSLSIWYGSMDFAMYDIRYGLFSLAGSLCGSFLVIKVFLYLNCLENRVFDMVRWMGRYSMWILCIHSVEWAVVPWSVLFAFVPQETWVGAGAQFVLRWIFIGCACQCLVIWQNYRSRSARAGH